MSASRKHYHKDFAEFVARIHTAAAAYGQRKFTLFGNGRYAKMLRIAAQGYSPAQVAFRMKEAK
jgi:hypothetical protein